MRFVFLSYVSSPAFNNPQSWLKRINIYAGIFTELAKTHTVISIEQINYQGDYEVDGVQYLFRQYNHWQRLLPFKLHRLIKQMQPDVVVVQGLHFPLQVLQLRMALGHKAKIILQNHAELPYKRLGRHLQRIASYAVDACLFASQEFGRQWVALGNLASAQKIYEVMEVSSVFKPIDRHQAQAITGVNGAPVFLWVGHLNANKDPLTAVSAFLQYAAVQPGARLYMIYQTTTLLPAIQQLIAQHPGKKDNIILVGPISHEDMAPWFCSADFLLSASHYEGSGTALAEAMSCRCIPVVSNIPSFRMITDNGRCGILFEPGNTASLLQALHQTSQLDLETTRTNVFNYYTGTLSFSAIASRFSTIAGAL